MEKEKKHDEDGEYMKAKDYKLTDWGGYAIGVLMEDANIQENLIMKMIGKKPSKSKKTPPRKMEVNTTYIDDWEFPDMTKDDGSKWLKYRRYSCSFRTERFQQLEKWPGLKLSFAPDNREKIERINQMDCTDMIDDLCAIGAAVAKEQVRESHFQGFTENPINPSAATCQHPCPLTALYLFDPSSLCDRSAHPTLRNPKHHSRLQ